LTIYLIVAGVVATATAACLQLAQFWVAKKLFLERRLSVST
jgi:hypothetical protein